ncbi:hypothetical protein THRCLA_00092 [Thraustotheca clavata]|uniref:Uncharacterized protein n=1 Tax=Thraustotheca clavata TaxID=74557 RepID=A0A1W0ACA1_9STRA|nr:hypothetical protein THRCLA_00092 [Thraustotheca clavata]
MAGASSMALSMPKRISTRSFSTKLSLLKLTNSSNRQKVWHQALQVWPLEKWKNVLKKDLKVLEHQHVFAEILQDNGPMNHYYLLKAHPSVASHVLELIVDATREYPYVHPKHREMDLIKVLRQIALATSQENMLQAVQTTLNSIANSPDVVPLYKSVVAASEDNQICLKSFVSTLLQQKHYGSVIELLKVCKNTTTEAPIAELTKLFHQLAKFPSNQQVQSAIALAFDWNLPSNSLLYSNMLSACIKANELSLALDAFHRNSNVQWTEPSVYALIIALSKHQEYKAAIAQVYRAASVPLTSRLLKYVLLAAQQMDSPSFLNQVLSDTNNNGFLTELLLTCSTSAITSVQYEQLAATLHLYSLQLAKNHAEMIHALGHLHNSVNSKLGLRISNLVIAQQVRHDPSFSIAIYKALFQGAKFTMYVRGSFHALLLGLASHGHFHQVVELLDYALVNAIKPHSDDMAAVLSAVRKHPQADQFASVILTKYLEILTRMRIPTTLRVYQHMIQLGMAVNRPDHVFQVYDVMQNKRIKPTEPITIELLRAVQPRTLYGDFTKFKHVYNEAISVGISSTRFFGLVLKVACYEHDSAFLGRVLKDIAFNARAFPPPRMPTS